ncbi:DUF7657 domain-containing protein [Enterococcus sp. CSURQ0835]|uniref:DUF7657 domain-containing protein n=1 Tax=Enterococcus sp. CSURQ0835 TaxID=2681394 RepID=UPI0013574076|nr:hypothetical protein [Enterococcus sp. CSURQ0835]
MESRKQIRKRQQSNKPKIGSRLLNQLIKFRYLIGLFALILIVALNLNGSSLNVWDNYVAQRNDGKTTDVLFGKARTIRSDEWRVQAPFYFSQTEADYPVNNPDYGLEGQNMIVAYNAPVKDLTAIGKPFNWGFFFLGRDHGLAFYWGFKLIGMLLLAFEVSLILTKKRRGLSLIGAALITFSPAVQWWFMQHAGDLVFFTLGLMLAFYHYFAQHEKRWLRLLMVLLAMVCGLGFVLVIYPAHQVLFGYFLLFWVIAVVVHFRKKVNWDLLDLLLIVPAVAVVSYTLWHFYQLSSSAITASLDTVYPGRRIATGGKWPIWRLFLFLTNWKLPFATGAPYENQVESANFFNLYLISVPAGLVVFKTKQLRQKNFFVWPIFLFSFFVLFWLLVGLPAEAAKWTLLSFVVTKRAMLPFGFAAALVTIWLLGVLAEKAIFSRTINWLLIGLSGVCVSVPLLTSKINGYLTEPELAATIIIYLFLMGLVLFRQKIAGLLLLAITIVMGCFVNPITEGTGAIFEKSLAQAIQLQNKKDPDKLWLTEGALYNFTPALGVRSLNTVRFYPDAKLWQQADPAGHHEKVYNRYAHMTAFVTPKPTSYDLTYADSFTMDLNFRLVEKLGVNYVVSQRMLENYNSLNALQFIRVYGPESDGWSIYQVKSSSESAESLNAVGPQ